MFFFNIQDYFLKENKHIIVDNNNLKHITVDDGGFT